MKGRGKSKCKGLTCLNNSEKAIVTEEERTCRVIKFENKFSKKPGYPDP